MYMEINVYRVDWIYFFFRFCVLEIIFIREIGIWKKKFWVLSLKMSYFLWNNLLFLRVEIYFGGNFYFFFRIN